MDKVVRVFFSQPMHGLTDEEIIFERDLMKQEFWNFLCYELGFDNDVEIIDVNYIFNDPGPENAGRLWYLGRSIQTMDRADYVCFSKNWTEAKGCLVEMNVCSGYFDKHKHFVHGKHIRDICWGNNSGSKDLTVSNSDDS